MSLLPFVTECGPTTLSPLLRRALAAEKLAEDNGKLAHDLSIKLEAHSKALERARRAIDELMTDRDALADSLDTLTLVIGLTPIAGNKEALQEALDQSRALLKTMAPEDASEPSRAELEAIAKDEAADAQMRRDKEDRP